MVLQNKQGKLVVKVGGKVFYPPPDFFLNFVINLNRDLLKLNLNLSRQTKTIKD